MMLCKKIGQQVATIRKSKGYGQAQLAEVLQISHSSASNKEKNYRSQTFSIDELAKVSKWLDIDFLSFFNIRDVDVHYVQRNGRMARSETLGSEEDVEAYEMILTDREKRFVQIMRSLDALETIELYDKAVELMLISQQK